MNITHLIFSFNIGGAENMLVDIINEQVLSQSVHLIIVNNDVDNDLLMRVSSKVNIIKINRVRNSKNILHILKLNYVLIKINPDIIHCHNTNLISCLIGFRKKSVITIHDTKLDYSKMLSKYCQIFAISESVKKAIAKNYKLESIVVYNGIDIKKISTKVNSQCAHSQFRILQISRLNHNKKGQHIAIEALSLIDKQENIHLDFIGIGSSESFLQDLVNKYKLNNNISFLGLKDREYIYKYLREYDLVIQPSIYEGFGLTVVESMIAKVPVLVSNIEGPMEIIQENKYGYSFESGSPIDLAEKIIDIKHMSKKKIDDITCNAYSYALQNFNIKDTAFNYINEYKKTFYNGFN